jgi:hypothetical protein
LAVLSVLTAASVFVSVCVMVVIDMIRSFIVHGDVAMTEL